MITRKIQKKLAAALLCLPLLLLASCIDEQYEGGKSSGGKEATVTFSLHLPGASKPATRAMAETDENEVRTVEVLQFHKNGGNYIRTTLCNVIATDGGDSRIKSFTVKLIKGEYDLMILANPRPRVKAGYAEGATRQAVMDALYADLPAGDKWNAATGTYSPIPMWGDVNDIQINDNTSTSVQLARMVAKVNVQVTGAATSKFLLKSVRVYNYNSQGSLVPAAANWNSGSNIATAPTVPTGSDLRGNPDHLTPAYKTPLVYDGAAITTANVASEGEIYLFESVVGSGSSLSSNTCLVIGGQYDGSGTETFYRVDFANKSGNTWNYLPLLRNHKYIVNISTVSGKGFDDPTDAFNSAPVNIEANVLEWNDGGMGIVHFDGQNYLSLKPETIFNFFKDADQDVVKVKTDVPQGFKVIKITEADGITTNSGWLTTDKTTGIAYGTGEIETPMAVIVTENTGGVSRTGYIFLQAGRLVTKLTVNQGIKLKKVPLFTFLEMINVDGAGTNVPLTGGTITAKVNTNMGWSLKSDVAGLESSMSEPISETASQYTLSVVIPQTIGNGGWGRASTSVWVEYQGAKINQTTYTQTGYEITITGAPASVNKYGGDVTLYLAGYFPAMKFRAVNAADVSKVVSDVVVCSATGSVIADDNSTVVVKVYGNTSGASRNVKLQYEKTTNTWVDIATLSQEWNGLILPAAGTLAPPNVLGVGAETGRLTLDGSKEYSADGKGYAGETVYAVYFKWGSTIAVSAGTGAGDAFDKTDVAWVPPGFTGAIMTTWSAVPYQASGSSPIQNDAIGQGDPCNLAVKGGSTGEYKMPSAAPWFESIVGGNLTTYAGINGRMNGSGTQFYPALGYRPGVGNLTGMGTNGYFWIAAAGGTSASYMGFNTTTVWPGNSTARNEAFTVRCVPK